MPKVYNKRRPREIPDDVAKTETSDEYVNVYFYDFQGDMYQQIIDAGGIVREMISGGFPYFSAWISLPKMKLKEERKNPPYDFEAGYRLEINKDLSLYVCRHEKEGNYLQALHWEIEGEMDSPDDTRLPARA